MSQSHRTPAFAAVLVAVALLALPVQARAFEPGPGMRVADSDVTRGSSSRHVHAFARVNDSETGVTLVQATGMIEDTPSGDVRTAIEDQTLTPYAPATLAPKISLIVEYWLAGNDGDAEGARLARNVFDVQIEGREMLFHAFGTCLLAF